ncbi:predicted protein [Uncinocarpus reesii 1704]|uniref:SIS domain-containing protein n=1 Tax=Uncinocarpus reesii (strain UAMH 1704) TaxID=336963 RepID=C4JH27_UNCRE|nr:uncharacterized protein UREG_01278 [Uncinocarpus reesii 1704]EEP76429.1 predicted protein [Uncinocarpus reesii 1704]
MTFAVLARKRRRQLSPPSPPIAPKRASQMIVPPLPMTPPDPDADPIANINPSIPPMDTVVHVIATEKAALANLERIYTTDTLSRENMERAVERVARTINIGGKLVICGVGKSGKIGEKLVATMNSFGIQSCFLHPTEALHGDLGMIRLNDTLLFITFSGKTSELLVLLPHLPPTLPVIAITSHMQPSSCALLSDSDIRDTILLPAPVHEREEVSFGLPAPTTSTTVALALGDALALAIARKLHTVPGRGPAEVFKGFHPGGAIGAAFASSSSPSPSVTPSLSSVSSTATSLSSATSNAGPTQANCLNPLPQSSHQKLISSLATPYSSIPIISYHTVPYSEIRIADALAAAVRCPEAAFWVLVTPSHLLTPRVLRRLAKTRDPGVKFGDFESESHDLFRKNWIHVPKSSTIADVRQILNGIDSTSRGREPTEKSARHTRNRVVALMNDKSEDDLFGFVEEREIPQ